jgi:polygalacturonase
MPEARKKKARRDFLKFAGAGIAGAAVLMAPSTAEGLDSSGPEPKGTDRGNGVYEVNAYGAKGNRTTIDTPAINRAIEAAAASGGGTVHFAAGQYLCYSILVKSNVSADLFHIKSPPGSTVLDLRNCKDVNTL